VTETNVVSPQCLGETSQTLSVTLAVSPICFLASAAVYSGSATATADRASTTAIHINTPGKVFVIVGAMLIKNYQDVERQIRKDQCKKLQKFIMSMETAERLDELFELSRAR
jgi:hypothetical protein